MNKKLLPFLLLATLIALVGCQVQAPTPTPTPTQPDPTATVAAPTPAPQITPEVEEPALPDEAIMILSPGSGSRVTNPIRLSGEANSTFEQNLVIRVLQDDGVLLLETHTTIQAEMGQRGPFEAEFNLPLEEERNVFIQVLDVSARDGGVTHLSSVGLMFSPTGPEEIVVRTPQPEQIVIFTPQMRDTLRGGVVVVEGFGWASFEQTLVVEVYDGNNTMIGQTPVMVQSLEHGVPGPFQAEVAYTLAAPGSGRVVVRDISPAHGDSSHVSSVEVQLEP
ncbi:MAG TPA: Gmad2 immunoglobulin-like domain-containing protein [Levilinea sp.]|nr:Gmad2 immunoglobulin-like domain-containing protein [Levilinea sp.]